MYMIVCVCMWLCVCVGAFVHVYVCLCVYVCVFVTHSERKAWVPTCICLTPLTRGSYDMHIYIVAIYIYTYIEFSTQ